MSDNTLELMAEADRRGILPADKKALFDEAKSRGLVPGFESTPGGAAVGNPAISGSAEKSLRQGGNIAGERLGTIAGAGGIGAVMGLASPEIMTAAGGVAAAFPATAPAAPFLFGAANATRGARLAATVAGGVSGMASEVAGQAAESAGAGPLAAEAARLAGGLAPEFKTLAVWGIRKAIAGTGAGDAATVLWNAVKAMGGGKPENLTENQRKFMETLISDLRGGVKSDNPLLDVYGGIERGASDIHRRASDQAAGIRALGESQGAAARTRAVALSKQQADEIIANAETMANKEIYDAGTGDVRRLRNAIPRLGEIGQSALDAAKNARGAIGNDIEVSDIGGALRQKIVGRNEAALTTRAAEYAKNEAERDAVVTSKEAAGQFIEGMPEYKALLTDLRNKLLIGQKAQEQSTAPVTEQGVLTNYQRIYEAVRSRRVQSGVNEEGNPIFKTFPTSFAALDDVRRKLGTVFTGKPAEGYEGINAATARDIYAKITDIQKKYAGEPQERLLSRYAESSDAISQFGAKPGRRVTAVDRYDDSKFTTDQSALPGQFFGSKQGVADLIELTGDRAAVVQSAKDYATNRLRDKTSQQVRAWLTTNRDWISALPEVGAEVAKYAATLEKAERIARNTESAAKRLGSRAETIMSDAERSAAGIRTNADREARRVIEAGERSGEADLGRIVSGAERSAGETVSAAQRDAGALLGNKFPAERVRQLIESGDVNQWRLAGPAIASDPTAKAAVFDAVRQTLAGRAERSAAGLSEFYTRNVKPALEGTGLITASQAATIEAKLANIEKLRMPEQQKLGLAKRVLLQVIGGYTASTAARGGATAINAFSGN